MIEQLEFMYSGVFFCVVLCTLLGFMHNVIKSYTKLYDFFAKDKRVRNSLKFVA